MHLAYTLQDYRYDSNRIVPHSYTVYGDTPLKVVSPTLQGLRVLDLGCGRGFWSDRFAKAGARVTGVDASSAGIARARDSYPEGDFRQLPITEDLLEALGHEPFDAVVSIEVVEHVYDPRGFARSCFNALKPGGALVLTTPYHGYLKNLALSIVGGWDRHFTALWDGGHVKFWSRRTLTLLLQEIGFEDIRFSYHGRVPLLWMGMLAVAKRPLEDRCGKAEAT